MVDISMNLTFFGYSYGDPEVMEGEVLDRRSVGQVSTAGKLSTVRPTCPADPLYGTLGDRRTVFIILEVQNTVTASLKLGYDQIS